MSQFDVGRILALMAVAALARSACALPPTDNAQGNEPWRTPEGSPVAMFAEIPLNSAWGYDYVRILPSSVTIGHLDRFFTAGEFADNDFSREYAIEFPSGDLYTIDTSNAEVTRIGSTGLGSHVTGIRWDASSGVSYAMTVAPDCSKSSLYTLDLTGATALVGIANGVCLITMAIDASGAAYGIDPTLDSLFAIDTTTGATTLIGSIGFNIDRGTAMDFVIGSPVLFVIGDDVSSNTRWLFTVDVGTGNPTPIGPFGARGPALGAFAIGTFSPQIFGDGFGSAPGVSGSSK